MIEAFWLHSKFSTLSPTPSLHSPIPSVDTQFLTLPYVHLLFLVSRLLWTFIFMHVMMESWCQEVFSLRVNLEQWFLTYQSYDKYLMSTNYVSGNNSLGARDKVVTKIGMWSPVIESFQLPGNWGGHFGLSPGISESLDAILRLHSVRIRNWADRMLFL